MARVWSLVLAFGLGGLVSAAPVPSRAVQNVRDDGPPSASGPLGNSSLDQKTSFFSMKAAMTDNFADPALLKDGDTFWAFATDNVAKTTGNVLVHGGNNVQMAQSSDFKSWNYLKADALPFAGKWAANPPHVWAPDVVKLDNGHYVLYYAASPSSDPTTHCVGAASSDSIQGPYKPQDQPLYCANEEGGAIDPSGFRDPADGKRYVMLKIDGNHNQPGGVCGNINDHPRATPIRMQEVSKDDGMTLLGDMVQILDRDDSDGALVEAPSMVAVEHGGAANGYMYILLYSSHCFLTPNYNVRYATSTNGVLGGANPVKGSIAKGAYKKNTQPLITTDSSHLVGPGGLDVDAGSGSDSGSYPVVFHAAQVASNAGSRQMHTGMIHINGETVTM